MRGLERNGGGYGWHVLVSVGAGNRAEAAERKAGKRDISQERWEEKADHVDTKGKGRKSAQ